MRKRKERRETLIMKSKEAKVKKEDEEEDGEEEKGFFACYLLCSLCPRFKGQTYIGFTINPRRRIRQHNGEIKCGAWRTKSKRPWEMILCIFGFPTNICALQFEWAWQHPTVSLSVRKAAASMKSLSGIVGKIKLAYTMLTLPPWQRLKLTVNFFSTKYMKDAAGCPSLPKQMKVQVCPMDELLCYTGFDQILDEKDDQDDEDEDAENGTNNRHVEESTDISEYLHSSVETGHDIQRWNKNDTLRQTGEPLTLRAEDYRLPLHHDSPLRSPSSSNTSMDNTLEADEDRDPFGLIEGTSNDYRRVTTTWQGTPPTAANEDQPPPITSPLFSPEFASTKPNDPFNPREEDHRVQFCLVDTPVKTQFSGITGLINTGETVEDRDPLGLIQDSSDGVVQSPKQRPETRLSAVNKKPPSTWSIPASPNVEVIDISTPSPNFMINSFPRKKRRNAWVSQEIIDLTKSPNFIQL